MIEKPNKYLDDILKFLSQEFGRLYTIQQIQNHLTPIEMFGEKGDVNFSRDLLIDLRTAITFLNSKGYIEYDNLDDAAKLTFEGYYKLKTNSFTKELRDKSINQTLQRIAWIIPIGISLVALYFSIKSYNTKTENLNLKTLKESQPPTHAKSNCCTIAKP